MEDREIIDRILCKSDTKCYREIVGRYSGKVFSKVLSIVKREELAKEITQQAFIRAYINLDSWKGTSLGPWLNAVAVHIALNTLCKERKRHAEPIEQTVIAEHPQEYSDEHEQLLQLMEKAIGRLSPSDRNIICMHYYQRMKTDEIAKTLGMTKSNVLVKLHRIRERLKKDIQNERNQ